MKRILCAVVLAALVLLPALADAGGWGGRSGGFSSSRSFGGSNWGGSRGFSAPRASGWGASSHSATRPSQSWRSAPRGSGWGQGRQTQTRIITRNANRNAAYVAHSGGYGYGYGGGNGFFTGMMLGSMMNHPYYGAMYAPPAYVGYTGGYGLSGYYAGGAYYPYSTAGYVFSCIFTLLMVFIITWVLAVVIIAIIRHPYPFDNEEY